MNRAGDRLPIPIGASVIAVDIGGTTVKGALVEASGTLAERVAVPTFSQTDPDHPDNVGASALATVIRVIEQLAASAARARTPVAGIGLCAPGVVNSAAGIVEVAVNLGWNHLPIARILADRFGVPVTLDHDARSAARAERAWRTAIGSPVDELVFIPIGTGIAATLFISDRAVRGATGAAGEFGHVPVVPNGERCTCGQLGCIEAYASASSILRRYRVAGGTGASDTRGIAEILDSDPTAASVWNDAVAALASGILMLTAVIDPAVIVIGGGLGESGERLLTPLRTRVFEQLTWRQPPRIEQSLAGASAGLTGAALLIDAKSVQSPVPPR